MSEHDTGTIVVGVDGSTSAMQATRWAASEASRRGSDLRLVHVRPLPLLMPPEDHLMRDLTDHGRKWLSAAREEALNIAPIDVRTELRTGQAGWELVSETEDAELIVVGSRGLGGFRSLLLGSVANALAAHGHCPVVVLRGRTVGDPAPGEGPVVVGADGTPQARTLSSSRSPPLPRVASGWSPCRRGPTRASSTPGCQRPSTGTRSPRSSIGCSTSNSGRCARHTRASRCVACISAAGPSTASLRRPRTRSWSWSEPAAGTLRWPAPSARPATRFSTMRPALSRWSVRGTGDPDRPAPWYLEVGEAETAAVGGVAVADSGVGVGEAERAAVAGRAEGGVRRVAERPLGGGLAVAERVGHRCAQDEVDRVVAGWLGWVAGPGGLEPPRSPR